MDGGELQVERATGKTKQHGRTVCSWTLLGWGTHCSLHLGSRAKSAMTESDRSNRCGRRGIRQNKTRRMNSRATFSSAVATAERTRMLSDGRGRDDYYA